MESSATRTTLTPDNIPAAETYETTTCFTLRRLEPLSPSPSLEQKRHPQLAPWLMPSRFSEDFPDPEGEYQGGETPEVDQRRELHSRVQTRSSDTCPQVCHIMNQNMQGITEEEKLDKTIKLVITGGIHGYCLQEMCILGTFFQNDPRTTPASPRHEDEYLSQGSGKQRCRNNTGTYTTKGLGHGGENTSHHLRFQLQLPRLDDRHQPMLL